jgi:hypothetical protein
VSKSVVSAVVIIVCAVALTLPLLPSVVAPSPPQSALLTKVSKLKLAVPVHVALLDAERDAVLRVERHSRTGLEPVEIELLLQRAAAAQSDRVLQAVRSALDVFSVWYGAFPSTQLVVVDMPWGSELVGASYPDIVAIGTRWIVPAREMSIERSIVGAMARQYLFAAASRNPSDRWFDEALALYTGTRAVHEARENDNADSVRLFGAHLPVVIRAVQLSPNRVDPRPRVRYFREIDASPTAPWRSASAAPGSPAQRGALALHTLERFIGWPAMQQLLAGYRERARLEGGSPALFAAIAGEQRGRSLSWFFDPAFRPDARFDYAIDRLASEAEAGQFRTTIDLRRVGDAVVAGTSEPTPNAHGRALAIAVAFDDGSEIREYPDGTAAATRLEYLSQSHASMASVDPDAVFVLDADRGNNTQRLRPVFNSIGARLALHWMVWLQDLMLSCTAFA